MTDTTTKLYDWIDEAARKSRGSRSQGYVNELAEEISERITSDDERREAIHYLVFVYCLTNWPLMGSALAEDKAESYDLMQQVAGQIADLSCRQVRAGSPDDRLRPLIAHAIRYETANLQAVAK
ncbi:MAG: hypothetical protein ACLQDY_12810 [Streptosporangiaceae bacterium]